MPKKLSKKARFLFEHFNWAIDQLRLYGNSKRVKKLAAERKEEVDKFLFPKKAKFFIIMTKKKKKKFKINKNADPRFIAAQLNGHKGGSTTAARYPKEVRQKWAASGGNKTASRYGREYYRHIRKKRKYWSKKVKRIRIEE
jgi:hypothetical protein